MEQYSPLIIAGLTIAVFILRQLMPKIPKGLVPLVTVVLAASVSVIGSGGEVNSQILIDGLLNGLGAIGLWEASKFARKLKE